MPATNQNTLARYLEPQCQAQAPPLPNKMKLPRDFQSLPRGERQAHKTHRNPYQAIPVKPARAILSSSNQEEYGQLYDIQSLKLSASRARTSEEGEKTAASADCRSAVGSLHNQVSRQGSLHLA